MTPSRSDVLACAIAVVAVAGCNRLKDVLALDRQLIAHFGLPMELGVSGNRLRVKLTNVQAGDDTTPRRPRLARAIAGFARTHYAQRDSLAGVTVSFERSRDVGGVTIHSTIAQYDFTAAELSAPRVRAAAAPPATSAGASAAAPPAARPHP